MNNDCLRTREKLEDTDYQLYLTPAHPFYQRLPMGARYYGSICPFIGCR